MGKFDAQKKQEIKKKNTASLNDANEEEAVLGSIEKDAPKQKHPGGRPKKKSIDYKKTELRIDKDLYYNLSILAEIDGRSTNSIICKILERYVNEEQNMQAIIKYLKDKEE